MSGQAREPAAAAPLERDRMVLVTGMSGAGKSTALGVLEDLGYEAIDNLPLRLLESLLRADGGGEDRRMMAVSVDSRTRDFTPEAFERVFGPLLARGDIDTDLLFIDCDDEVLQRRFTETRRRHPMATDRPVRDGIEHERKLISRLRHRASVVIDTSGLSSPDFRRLVAGHFRPDEESGLAITVTSFSYRRGLPREADLVFDVRFLANPHYDERLRPLTGLAPEVGAHIADDPVFTPFFSNLTGLVLSLLPHYTREGKRYLTIAVGCTGGRHRSVFVAERLAQLLREGKHHVNLRHRDMDAPTEG